MDYKDINDYEVLYMVEDESDEAFELLLKKYQPVIHQQIYKWKSIFKKLGLDRDDLEQEIYCAIVMALRTYDESENVLLYTYLTNVIEKRMCNIVRDHTTYKNCISLFSVSLSTPIHDNCFLEEILGGMKDVIELNLEEKILEKEILSFSYELSLSNAYIFELALNSYKVSDISVLLGIPVRDVTYILARIRRRLKKYLHNCFNLV